MWRQLTFQSGCDQLKSYEETVGFPGNTWQLFVQLFSWRLCCGQRKNYHQLVTLTISTVDCRVDRMIWSGSSHHSKYLVGADKRLADGLCQVLRNNVDQYYSVVSNHTNRIKRYADQASFHNKIRINLYSLVLTVKLNGLTITSIPPRFSVGVSLRSLRPCHACHWFTAHTIRMVRLTKISS